MNECINKCFILLQIEFGHLSLIIAVSICVVTVCVIILIGVLVNNTLGQRQQLKEKKLQGSYRAHSFGNRLIKFK